MEKRRLGNSSVEVSQIGLGTWGMSGAFWGAADDAESIRAIHRALDLGVTLIDTAEAYGGGHSEEVLGQALVGRRGQAVIATKAAPNHLAPDDAVTALEGSLKRLRTDYVDVYFIHWPNPDVPVGATMEALERLRASQNPRDRRLQLRRGRDGDGAPTRDDRRPAAALQRFVARGRG